MSKLQGFFRYLKKHYPGYLYVMPCVLGILIFTLYPMIMSLIYSFFDFSGYGAMTNFGFQNYVKAFTDPQFSGDFFKSISTTVILTVIGVPLGLVLSFAIALLLNKSIRGIGVFRLIFYIPVILPTVVQGLIWTIATDPDFGIFNRILGLVGIPPYPFFSDPNTALASYIFVGLFGLGGSMVIWIASLKAIPEYLYESADLDGAGWWRKLFFITLPMCSPMIFYNLIVSVVGSLQTFGTAFIISSSGGGQYNSLLFYVINIYNQAFSGGRMGFASALSWMLFILIGVLTAIIFKTSKWVFYGDQA